MQRKLPLAGGETVRNEIAQIRQVASDVAGRGGAGFGATAERLAEASDALEESTRLMLAWLATDQRNASAIQIVNRLRPQLAKVEGVVLYLQPAQDITVGGRIGRGLYQYTLKDANIDELNIWAQRLLGKLRTLPELADVSSDQQNNAPQIMVTINREAAPIDGGKMACWESRTGSAGSAFRWRFGIIKMTS